MFHSADALVIGVWADSALKKRVHKGQDKSIFDGLFGHLVMQEKGEKLI